MKIRLIPTRTMNVVRTGFFLILLLAGFACTPTGIQLATFKGEMIYSYLEKDSANNYTEFIKIVDRAGLKGMLSAYGDYTCLAPTNAAMNAYYHSFGPNFSIDSMTPGQIDTLARTHIIPNRYLTMNLKNQVLTNMNNRITEIKFDTINSDIIFNGSSRVILKDVEVYNGVVDGIDKVLEPVNLQLPDLIAADSTITIFSKALELTRLSDSLRLIIDKNYHPSKKFLSEYNTFTIANPRDRKFGFTAFIENDNLLSKYGVNNIQDLIQLAKQLYPPLAGEPVARDDDYTNRYNSLNKYIAYHLLNKAVYEGRFFYIRSAVKNYTPDEFYETMMPNRIIRASWLNNTVAFNTGTDYETHLIEKSSHTTLNGVYHLLDKMLVYTEGSGVTGSTQNMLLKTRIRFDFVSLFPEMTNNNIRGAENQCENIGLAQPGMSNSGFPWGDEYGFEPGYLSGIKFGKDTRLIYLSGKDKMWADFQADEFIGMGNYDMTIRLMPVPPGTYELRFGYSANTNRSITQLYVDGQPQGIPLDLRTPTTDPAIGALLDVNTDDIGYENDKMIRNRGYMKGPNTVLFDKTTLRDYTGALRRIVGTFSWNSYQAHTLRFRSVMNNLMSQCMIDYIEIVPKAVYNSPDGEPESRD